MNNNVQKYLEKRSLEVASDWSIRREEEIENCYLASLIEQLFLIEYYYQMISSPNRMTNNFYIGFQKDIQTQEGKKYRVDFFIYYTKDNMWMTKEATFPEHNKDKVLIVELDSFLWHGQTPEQFEREKRRERDLMNEGYKIMRFSGREIVRNTEKCVQEAIDYFNEK